MSEKLLPCPFCEADILSKTDDHIQCLNCGCALPTTDTPSATAAWNRRTPAPEGEAVKAGDIAQMTCFANNHGTLEDWAAWCRIRASLASPVVPVGVSREEIARIANRIRVTAEVYEDGDLLADADAILAAFRPTDTGREG